MKRIFLLLALIIVFSASCASKPAVELSDAELRVLLDRDELPRGRVTEILSDGTNTEDYGGTSYTVRTIIFKARLTRGDFKGGILTCEQLIESNVAYKPLPVSVGDRLFLYISEDTEGNVKIYYDQPDRTSPLIWLAVIFAVALLLFGRSKGLRALVALIATCAAIFLIFLPHVANGGSPVWSSILVCIAVTLITMVIVAGFSVKSLSSTLGCLTGILTAGLLSAIAQNVMKLTGFIDEHSASLAFQAPNLDMAGLLFAATIIGAMGATMDVAISIATSLEELAAKTDMKPMELVRSGLKIGRDIMGTMSNTLILAYVGGSLNLILLLAVNTMPAAYVLSWEMLATEIVRAVAGSLGLIMAVPATAFVSGMLYRKGVTVGTRDDGNPFS